MKQFTTLTRRAAYRAAILVAVPVASATFCTLPAVAAGGSIYTDLGATAPGYSTGFFYTIQGPASSQGSIMEAAQFVPTSSGYVTEVDAALQGFQTGAQINVSIVADSNNTPSTTSLFSATTSINTTTSLYPFNASNGQLLTAGTPYWLVVAPSTTYGANWFGNNGFYSGLQASNYHNQGYMVSNAGLPAFQLSGIVTGTASAPEPGCIALFALAGLPVAGAIARRRRKTSRTV